MTQTQPSSLSVPSLYLSNWQDLVAVWQSHSLSKIASWQAPGIRELHYLGDSGDVALMNQIVDWTGFFQDATGSHSYTDVSRFETAAWFENSDADAGTLTTNYLSYDRAQVQPRCAISRSYVAVPYQRVIVVRYRLENLSESDITFRVLDQLHPANHGLAAGAMCHVSYDESRRALIVDRSASGQPFLALGALDEIDGLQAGDEGQTDGARCGGWASFNRTGTLPGNVDVVAPDVDLAFSRTVVVPAAGTAETCFYLTLAGDLASIQAQADQVRAQPGAFWFTQTAIEHAQWLANGSQGGFPDEGLNVLLDRCLIVAKHAQNPALGPFAATTNPVAYRHLSWVRDSAITAIALDVGKHHEEAGLYWRWMASVQEPNGTWRTRSCVWDGADETSGFVSPEYDSVGQFLYGAWRHYDATGDRAFLGEIWPKAKLAADWILNQISPENGLGAADHSIWEEEAEYNAFTQGWYVAGLYAAQLMAEALGEAGLADWYAGGPASIISAIQRRSDANPPGLWNPNGYINRAVTINEKARPQADSSSNIIPALGVIDPDSGRAAAHVATMLRLLTRDGYGLARYPQDRYYFDEPYDPAGDEADGAEPSWPQMSMWVAVYEALTGDVANATKRLQWFASTSGAGYMPQGEAVSNVTSESVMSSMSEPLTAASFVIAAMTCVGQADPRIEPKIRQSGCSANLALSLGAEGDLSQWDVVPYAAVFNTGRGTRPSTSVARCWLANNDADLFIRVDNAAGYLSAYNTDPKFAVCVYSGDFAGGPPGASTGLDGKPMARPAKYALRRTSDDTPLERWVATDEQWQDAGPSDVDLVPQWNPATGVIEAKIPVSAVSTGAMALNSWAFVTVAIVYRDDATQSWVDDGRIVLHYRLTRPEDPPIYGNVRA